MRTLDLGFRTHIESGATTLATCWRIARTDGVVLGFTDHDELLVWDGTTFEPMLEGGEATSKLGPQTDTSEVVGVLTSDAIVEADILLGRFDGASVETWRVNWRDVSQRLLQRRATIGEITREDGVFRAELRSAQQTLNQVRGRLYQALCDAELGDARCGVDVEDSEFRAEASVAAVRDRFRIAVSGVEAYAEGWFGFGTVAWSAGQRAGLRDRVVSHQRLGAVDVFGFGVPVGDWVVEDDAFVATAGCDRRLATCREKFGNVPNFRGFPHVPGSDFVLRYPRDGAELDGRALFG
jgi:uncharacterized phage protein (TIGR02218 family)